MKEFIYKIPTGIKKSEINQDDLEIIQKLVKENILKDKKNSYKLSSKYKIGKIDVARSGTGFLELIGERGKDILIEANDLRGAFSGDIVVIKRVYGPSRAKGKVVFILHKEKTTRLIVTKKISGKILGVDIVTNQHIDITESQKSLKKLPPQTLLKIDSTSNRVLEVVGVLSDSKVDEKISLALYNKKDEFDKKTLREAQSFGDNVDSSMYLDRVDLTGYNLCTIDPVDAKDFDDAIYYDENKRELIVAIADVSEYVFELGGIDTEARSRSFSIYLPHKSIPMLPRNLSENICSLKPNLDRLAFCFKITFDENYNVIKEELFEAIINSKRRFNYDEVDELLKDTNKATSTIDKEILKFLIPLYEVTQKLRKERLKHGFDLSSDEIRMILDDNQNLLSTRLEEETPSHGLIEDCMLLANKAAAKMLDNGIYRIHGQPKDEKIDNMLSSLSEIGIVSKKEHSDVYKLFAEIQKQAIELDIKNHCDRLLIKSQQSACYSSENIGHFGLGFSEYTHFTSPIRRYSDLLLHRLLKAKIRGDEKKLRYLAKDISTQCETISKLEREAAKVEWDYMDRKFARWAKEHRGEIFNAIVVDTKKTPIAILKDKLEGARIFVTTHRDVSLFENIKISISDSDLLSGDIIGKLEESLRV